jgi:hypothetical protein
METDGHLRKGGENVISCFETTLIHGTSRTNNAIFIFACLMVENHFIDEVTKVICD